MNFSCLVFLNREYSVSKSGGHIVVSIYLIGFALFFALGGWFFSKEPPADLDIFDHEYAGSRLTTSSSVR